MPEETVDATMSAQGGGMCSSLVVRCVNELIGCMIFIASINLAVTNAPEGMAGLAIGSTLMVIIYLGGHVSGGHYNPAVSLGIFLRLDGFSMMELICYCCAQVVGGIIGALLSYAIAGNFTAGMMCENKEFEAILVELVYTYLLVSTVLNVATSNHPDYQGNSFFALAIGFSVVVGAYCGGSVSGGAFNPAVQLGLEFGNLFAGNDCFGCIFLVLAQLVGGLIAGLQYKFLVLPFHKAQGF